MTKQRYSRRQQYGTVLQDVGLVASPLDARLCDYFRLLSTPGKYRGALDALALVCDVSYGFIPADVYHAPMERCQAYLRYPSWPRRPGELQWT